MDKIIPVINVKTSKDFFATLGKLGEYKGWLQIDIADGKFTNWKNFSDPSKINDKQMPSRNSARYSFELHLMVQDVENTVAKWLGLKPKRIIIPVEVKSDLENLFLWTKKSHGEIGFSVNPATSNNIVLEKLKPNANKIGILLFLGVKPGPSGQEFDFTILERVKYFHKLYPKLKIEVDGGVNEENIKAIFASGANMVAVGSAIFQRQEKPLVRIKMLEEIIG
jgi:ribulose-phosphate 3-epimerase